MAKEEDLEDQEDLVAQVEAGEYEEVDEGE